MLLEELSYKEVEFYLEEKDIILVPIGSVEQHSPYGLIGTDFITAQEIAKEVGKRLDILVAPVLPYGMSQHHMAFAGTATLSPETYISVIKDIIKSYHSHGFRRIVFINGHGGNINPTKTAFDQIKHEGYSGIFEIISWYLMPEVQELENVLYGELNGYHATPSEVAITKFFRPYAFKTKPKTEKPVEKIEVYWPLSKDEFKKAFPDGRMNSAPWLANEKDGRLIFEEAVRAIMERVKEIMKTEIL